MNSLPIKTDTASGEKKSLNSGYIYKLIVTTYIRRFSNLKCLYLEDLGKYSRYISQVHYLPVNPYRLHAASTDTLHTVWSQEVHINRNEAYRSSIILPQLRRDALSTHFKRTRYINIPSLSATNTLKNKTTVFQTFPHFTHGFMENDNNYAVKAEIPEILKGVKMFPSELKIF